jgi:hypothetical protein
MSERIIKADIPVRIRRLKELAGKLSVEALRVCQHRNPLKPDEIKAYSSNLVQAIGCLQAARAALEKAMERMR